MLPLSSSLKGVWVSFIGWPDFLEMNGKFTKAFKIVYGNKLLGRPLFNF